MRIIICYYFNIINTQKYRKGYRFGATFPYTIIAAFSTFCQNIWVKISGIFYGDLRSIDFETVAKS